jgi:DNA-binding LytR/AlgR family response regulator
VFSIVVFSNEPKLTKMFVDCFQTLNELHHVKINPMFFDSYYSINLYFNNKPTFPNLLIINTNMDGKNGIKFAQTLRKLNYNGQIIFISNSKELVFQTFSVQPFDYLLENKITRSKLLEVFSRGLSIYKSETIDKFFFRIGKRVVAVSYQDIIYFEKDLRKINIVTKTETYVFYGVFKTLSVYLQPLGFIQIHKSFIVNVNHTVTVSKQKFLLKNGKSLPIGYVYMKNIKQMIPFM